MLEQGLEKLRDLTQQDLDKLARLTSIACQLAGESHLRIRDGHLEDQREDAD